MNPSAIGWILAIPAGTPDGESRRAIDAVARAMRPGDEFVLFAPDPSATRPPAVSGRFLGQGPPPRDWRHLGASLLRDAAWAAFVSPPLPELEDWRTGLEPGKNGGCPAPAAILGVRGIPPGQPASWRDFLRGGGPAAYRRTALHDLPPFPGNPDHRWDDAAAALRSNPGSFRLVAAGGAPVAPAYWPETVFLRRRPAVPIPGDIAAGLRLLPRIIASGLRGIDGLRRRFRPPSTDGSPMIVGRGVASGGAGWETFNPQAGVIRSLIEDLRPRRLLEVGGGSGRNLPLFESIPFTVCAEPDAIMVSRASAKRYAGRTALLRGDGAALPFRDGGFDLVLTVAVLQHVPPDRVGRVLSEIRRVSRGGRFAIIEHGRSEREDPRRAPVHRHRYPELAGPDVRLLRDEASPKDPDVGVYLFASAEKRP